MSTVDKATADRIIAGAYPEDKASRIVEYTNAWGGLAYGVTFGRQPLDTYLEETEYVINPRIYWEAKGT